MVKQSFLLNYVRMDAAEEISPFLTLLFQQSFEQGAIPDDWSKALVSAIYKKGKKDSPANYRPVSLTCILSKIMEHVIVSHTMSHLDNMASGQDYHARHSLCR